MHESMIVQSQFSLGQKVCTWIYFDYYLLLWRPKIAATIPHWEIFISSPGIFKKSQLWP